MAAATIRLRVSLKNWCGFLCCCVRQDCPGEVQVRPSACCIWRPHCWTWSEIPIPSSFRGRSHAALLDAGKEARTWENDAVIECISGCKNPFVVEDRLQARLLAVREARYKMVLDFNSATEQLYDLDADPDERRPLPPGAEKAVRRRLLDRARQHISDAVQSRDAEYRMAARLRDLRLATSARMDQPHHPDLRLA